MAEDLKALARESVQEIWNQHNPDAIDKYFSADVVTHDPTGEYSGTAAVRQQFEMFMSAFPDTKIEIQDVISEGDKVSGRWTATGTHKGALFGIPPTNKQCTMTGLEIDRIVDGKIVESWAEFNLLGLLQQIGAVPSMEAGAAR